MHVKQLIPLALGSTVSAQSLTDALASQNSSLSTLNCIFPVQSWVLLQLTNLSALLAGQPALVSALAGATNLTILAPSNDAFSAFLNTSLGASAAQVPDLVAALLTYHALNGSYPASAFTNTSMFIPTLLTNTSHTNVTGGQVVEAVASNDSVIFTSGLLSTSMVTTAVSANLYPA